jgi:putative redox protein
MIVVSHIGGDRLRIKVRSHEVFTDQPVAEGGDDLAPTPTELFVSSLGACVAFYAERFLRRHGMSTQGLEVACDYRWAENPHRVGEIDVSVSAPGLSPARREAFVRVIEHCTVHNSLEVPPGVSLRVAERIGVA